MQKEIVILVDLTGETEITTNGYRGPACLKATKPIEDALGIAAKRDLKPEYHALELPATAKVGQG